MTRWFEAQQNGDYVELTKKTWLQLAHHALSFQVAGVAGKHSRKATTVESADGFKRSRVDGVWEREAAQRVLYLECEREQLLVQARRLRQDVYMFDDNACNCSPANPHDRRCRHRASQDQHAYLTKALAHLRAMEQVNEPCDDMVYTC